MGLFCGNRGDFPAAGRATFAMIRAAAGFNAHGRFVMKHPLDSLWGTVIAGLILTALLYFLARKMMGM
jgi:hypothetical protein